MLRKTGLRPDRRGTLSSLEMGKTTKGKHKEDTQIYKLTITETQNQCNSNFSPKNTFS